MSDSIPEGKLMHYFWISLNLFDIDVTSRFLNQIQSFSKERFRELATIFPTLHDKVEDWMY